MGKLAGRRIVITGAAQGIGAVFAAALAAAGARVTVCDVQAPEHTVRTIKDAGGEAIGCLCDVTSATAVATLVAEAEQAFGGIDGLVHNAALFTKLPKLPLEQITSEAFDKLMAVKVRGAFECIEALTPVTKRQGYGKIVNIASGTVFKGQVMMLSYVTSKGAVVAMARCVARELGGHGIRANCLAPGFTMSEGVMELEDWVRDGQAIIASRCLRREQQPEDLAGTLEYLLSADSDFMSGQTIVVDGGSVMR